MHVKDAITTKQNVTLWANWRSRRSHYKHIQLYRTDYVRFQAPFGLNEKVIFRANCLFSRKIVTFRANLFRAPSIMPSRTLMTPLSPKIMKYSLWHEQYDYHQLQTSSTCKQKLR